METVSVYITTKNRPVLLARAIQSVLNQTYKDIELIIVDDGSTEDIYHGVVQPFEGKGMPIVFHRNEQSKGSCFSRNLAIDLATGRYVTGLDDDDEFVPTRVELLLKHYTPEYAFVSSNDNLILNNGKIIHTNRPAFIDMNTLLDAVENLVGNQVLTEKVKWQAIGGFDMNFPAFQDFDTFFRLTKKFGKGRVVQDNLQNIYRNDTTVKISTFRNQFRGNVFFYLKHKSEMTRRQKLMFILRYRLFKSKLLGSKGSKVSIVDIFRYSSSDALKGNIIMYVKGYLAKPQQ